MRYDSFINNDFCTSKEFEKLLASAKERQVELAKERIDDFYFSQNSLRKIKTRKKELKSRDFA